MLQEWPVSEEKRFPGHCIDLSSAHDAVTVMSLINRIRSYKATLGVPPSIKDIPLTLYGLMESDGSRRLIEENKEIIENRARVKISFGRDMSGGLVKVPRPEDVRDAVQFAFQNKMICALHIGQAVDLDLVKERLRKDLKKAEQLRDKTASKLRNPNFIKNAPEEEVNKNKERLEREKEEASAIQRILDGFA